MQALRDFVPFSNIGHFPAGAMGVAATATEYCKCGLQKFRTVFNSPSLRLTAVASSACTWGLSSGAAEDATDPSSEQPKA